MEEKSEQLRLTKSRLKALRRSTGQSIIDFFQETNPNGEEENRIDRYGQITAYVDNMEIFDNMQYIMGTDKTMIEMYLGKGVIEIEALAYIRGRSISDAFVIIDEAQNLTAHEVKTIITRIGENTKIVLTGDIEQIDNVYTNETSNGLTYAVEKLKKSRLSGHVTFKKGERAKLATEASKLL